jgi:outer membrane receptor protein involved in Fe transport
MPEPSSKARACACALPAALCLWLLAAGPGAAADGVISYPPTFFAAQRPANASEMLARIPGFTLDYGAFVRGFEGAAGNVLIDGQRPTSKSDNLNAILARIPAAKVERIDVIRGGAPGVDMQGKPVVANVILKTDQGFRGQVEANTSIVKDGRPLGGLEFQASGGIKDASWEASGLFAKGFSGLLGDGVGQEASTDGRPGRRTSITTEDDGRLEQVTGAYERPLAGGKLRLNGLAYHDDLKLEEDDRDIVSGAVESSDDLTIDDSRELGATFSRPLSARTKLELVGLYQTNGLDLTSAFAADGSRQLFAIDRTTRESIARAVLKQTRTETLSGEIGAEAADNRLESRTRFEIDGAAVPVPAANVEVREKRGEAFVKASWRLSPAWSLDGQLRYERSTISSEGDVVLSKTLSYLKPRLLVTWSARPATQVRLRIEREVGQLDFDAFVAQASLNSATGVTAGNPDLEPERAWVVEAAVEQRFWGRGALVVTATHSEVQGVVDRGPVFTATGVFDRPANIGDGTRDALKVDVTVPLERFGLTGAQFKGFVVRRWSTVEDPTTFTSRRISAQKPVEWEAHFTQDLPARNTTWGASLYGGYQRVYYRFNAVDAYKLDPFLMVFAEWRPQRDINIRAELENITERGYRHTTTTYASVRNADRSGPASLSDRNYHFGRIIYLRVRKTFGG